MSEESKEKQPFEEAIEIVLEAQPEAVLPVIHIAANELTFSDGHYYCGDLGGNEDITASIERCVIGVSNHKKVHSEAIGVITLQPFPGNRTLFRVPPRSKWAGLQYGNLDTDGSLFTRFLQHVFAEFQRIGFIDFREKPPLGFRLPHKEKNV